MAEVVASGRFILGPEVEAFEREFAAYLGVPHVVGVANGTDALTIALRAARRGPGRRGGLPLAHLLRHGRVDRERRRTPVFCDVDPETCCITAETVRPRLARATKAIVAVHLFGNVAPMAELRELGLPVIEDAAQAAGASLDGCQGRGARRGRHVQLLPVEEPALSGRRRRDRHRRRGARRAGPRAALPRLAGQADAHRGGLQLAARRAPGGGAARAARRARRLERRREAAPPRATSAPASASLVALPVPTAGAEHVYHLYVVHARDADSLAAGLGRGGHPGARLLPDAGPPPARDDRFAGEGELPVTDELAATSLALPMGPELTRGAGGGCRGGLRLPGPGGGGRVSAPVRIGVVGLGYWGPNLARNFDALPDAELAWVCDGSAESSTRGAPLPGRSRDHLARRAARRSAVSTPLRWPPRCPPTPRSRCACSKPASTASWRSRWPSRRPTPRRWSRPPAPPGGR